MSIVISNYSLPVAKLLTNDVYRLKITTLYYRKEVCL